MWDTYTRSWTLRCKMLPRCMKSSVVEAGSAGHKSYLRLAKRVRPAVGVVFGQKGLYSRSTSPLRMKFIVVLD